MLQGSLADTHRLLHYTQYVSSCSSSAFSLLARKPFPVQSRRHLSLVHVTSPVIIMPLRFARFRPVVRRIVVRTTSRAKQSSSRSLATRIDTPISSGLFNLQLSPRPFSLPPSFASSDVKENSIFSNNTEPTRDGPIDGLHLYPPYKIIHEAFSLPVPTKLPALDDRLEKMVFDSTKLDKNLRKVEWIGDGEMEGFLSRIIYCAVREIDVELWSKLAFFGTVRGSLVTNKHFAKLAVDLQMPERFAEQDRLHNRPVRGVSDVALADHFEIYVAVLSASKGERAVLELLAPLFRRPALDALRSGNSWRKHEEQLRLEEAEKQKKSSLAQSKVAALTQSKAAASCGGRAKFVVTEKWKAHERKLLTRQESEDAAEMVRAEAQAKLSAEKRTKKLTLPPPKTKKKKAKTAKSTSKKAQASASPSASKKKSAKKANGPETLVKIEHRGNQEE